jgi:hypothetical protein
MRKTNTEADNMTRLTRYAFLLVAMLNCLLMGFGALWASNVFVALSCNASLLLGVSALLAFGQQDRRIEEREKRLGERDAR